MRLLLVLLAVLLMSGCMEVPGAKQDAVPILIITCVVVMLIAVVVVLCLPDVREKDESKKGTRFEREDWWD